MSNKTIIFGLVIFSTLLVLPGIQLITQVFPEAKIVGMIPAPKPHLSWAGWFSGNLQEKSLTWFEQKAGFMNFLMKVDGQISYTFFHEASPGSNIIVGKENFLFVDHYVRSSQDLHVRPVSNLEPMIRQLKELQKLLQKRGVSFVLVISPNKARVYSEYVPSRYLVDKRKTKNTYDHSISLLKKHKINYVDGPEYFLRNKNTLPHPLFPRSGVHWSYYGVCKFSQLVVQELEHQMSKNLGELICDDVSTSTTPIGSDGDLAELMNIWTFQSLTSYPNFVPNVAVRRDTGAFMPAMMYVGDSFTQTLLTAMDGKIQRASDFLVYNRFCITFPGNARRRIHGGPAKLKKSILSKDAVIIQIQESGIRKAGFGFVENALAALHPAKYGHLYRERKRALSNPEEATDILQPGIEAGED